MRYSDIRAYAVRIISELKELFPAQSAAEDGPDSKRDFIMSRALLFFSVMIPVIVMLQDVIYLAPDLNDGAFHIGVIRNTINAVQEGANPLDFWVPTWLGGFPLFHYYQPGPYLMTVLAYFLTPGAVPLLLLYRLIMLIAMAAFPLANYRALRWLGFSAVTASWGAFFSTLISAGGKYGIELESFTWAGWGLFTQLIALPLLPLALAGGYRAVREDRRTLGYAAVLAAALLCHILYGYIAAISLMLVPFLDGKLSLFRKYSASLARFGFQAFCLVAFFVVPLVLNRSYHLKSLYDETSKFDSHGAKQILKWLFSGDLLDHGRLPVITGLVAVGLYISIQKWLGKKGAVHGWLAGGFFLWTLLYFGRATWGPLTNILPMSGGLHFERLSSGVHMFAIWLSAVPLGIISRNALQPGPIIRRSAAAGLIILLVAPVLKERYEYFVKSRDFVMQGMIKYDSDKKLFESALDRLAEDPMGRVYAGYKGNWGQSYTVGSTPVYQALASNAVSVQTYSPFSWSLTNDVGYQFVPGEAASYDLYNVQYLLTNAPSVNVPGAELIFSAGPHRLLKVQEANPFSIVSVPASIIGDKETTSYPLLIWAKGIWPRKKAVVELIYDGRPAYADMIIEMRDMFRYSGGAGKTAVNLFDPPALFIQEPPLPVEGRISGVRYARQKAEANVSMSAPGVILFKSTYHPNWHAEIDGKQVSTMLLSPGFVGVEVPAGNHHLSLSYRPGMLKMGLLIFGIAAAVGLELLRVAGRKRKNKA